MSENKYEYLKQQWDSYNPEINSELKNKIDKCFKEYKEQILAKELTLEKYTNRKSDNKLDCDYFCTFIENKSSSFYGSASAGSAKFFGIKKNDDKDTYYISKYKNNEEQEKGSRKDAEDVFKETLLPSLKNICIELTDENREDIFKTVEENPIISSKVMLRKVVAMTNMGQFLYMYSDESINTLYSFFIEDGEATTNIEKNYQLTEVIKDLFDIEVNSKTIILLSKFIWGIYNVLISLNLKKSIVYYGAPGTGKTYKAKEIVKDFYEYWKIKNNLQKKDMLLSIMQFHPSISYEDFIEGIRPSKDQLQLHDGVFKKFCKTAGDIEIKLWNDPEFKEKFQNKSDFETIALAKLKDMENVKKILNLEENFYNKSLTLNDVIAPAFFIIDEINRADLSRVFGELMYALEYRGYEGKIKTQYSYLIEKENDPAVFFYEDGENYFFIPQNIYIIGTMNTIDRSVDSFDFALRRRFSWEEIGPNYNVIRTKLAKKISKRIADGFENMNKKIISNPLLGSDYQIGHAYALNLSKHKDITTISDARKFIWSNFIEPLLQEYFRGLGNSFKEIGELKKAFESKDKNEEN